MLQKIRDKIQGWIAGVIIAIIAAAFMLFGVEYYLDRGASGSKTVATVDGTKITEQQLNSTYQQLERSQQRANHKAPLTAQMQQELKQYALQEMITNVALINAATKAGFRVSLAQVKQLVTQAPEFQVSGRFSPQRFQQLIYANQTTEPQFLARIQGNLLTNQVVLGIQSSEFVLSDELAQAYQLIYQKRNFGYFVIPLSKFTSTVIISDKAIKHSYEQNKDLYKTPEKTQISYLLLSPKAYEKNIKISEKELRAYYELQKANTSAQAKIKPFSEMKAKIKQVLLRQKVEQALSKKSDLLSNLTYTNPSTLTVAAKALGISVQTSPLLTRHGVKTGLFSNPSVMAAAFSDAVLKDRDNSNPITLKNGSVVVLRVSKYVPSSVQALAAVSQKIKKLLSKQKALSKAGLQAYQIETALGSGTSAQSLATKYGLTWVRKNNVSRKDKTISKPILAGAFSTTLAKDKKISGVNSLLMANGDYVVIKVFSANNADYSKATTKIKQQLAKELVNLWGRLDYKFYAKGVVDSAKVNTNTNTN